MCISKKDKKEYILKNKRTFVSGGAVIEFENDITSYLEYPNTIIVYTEEDDILWGICNVTLEII